MHLIVIRVLVDCLSLEPAVLYLKISTVVVVVIVVAAAVGKRVQRVVPGIISSSCHY